MANFKFFVWWLFLPPYFFYPYYRNHQKKQKTPYNKYNIVLKPLKWPIFGL